MIVSYSRDFIYWKPVKVGGTSVLQALGKHCRGRDIVGQPAALEGYEGFGRNMKKVAYNNHATPEMIRHFLKLSPARWAGFFKFTIVRNPWDECVSRFWHAVAQKRSRLRPEDVLRMEIDELRCCFKNYLRSVHNANRVYYFDENDDPVADFYIRFEQIESDYAEVCQKIGVPFDKLPRMKTDQRRLPAPCHYYYDEESAHLVAQKFAPTVSYFGYDFAAP